MTAIYSSYTERANQLRHGDSSIFYDLQITCTGKSLKNETSLKCWINVCSEHAPYVFVRWHIYHARKIMVSIHI